MLVRLRESEVIPGTGRAIGHQMDSCSDTKPLPHGRLLVSIGSIGFRGRFAPNIGLILQGVSVGGGKHQFVASVCI